MFTMDNYVQDFMHQETSWKHIEAQQLGIALLILAEKVMADNEIKTLVQNPCLEYCNFKYARGFFSLLL